MLTSFRPQSYYYFVRVSGSKSRTRLNSTIVYISYLYFQLCSHAWLYADEGEDMLEETRYAAKKHKVEQAIELQTPKTGTVSSATNTAVAHRPEDNCDVESGSADSKEGEIKQPQLSVWVTVGLLIVVTAVSMLYFICT